MTATIGTRSIHDRLVRRLRITALLAVLLTLSVSPGVAQLPGVKPRIFRPDGPGPHTAVLFVPGCEGFDPPMAPRVYERRAAALRGRGYLVLFVDYLGRRGLTSCAAGSITHDDAARDLIVEAAWLTTQASVDRARITAIGWSYGGPCSSRWPSLAGGHCPSRGRPCSVRTAGPSSH